MIDKHAANAILAAALHDQPPATFGTPALQSLIYATSNDRYPGAPGTLLHRAKLEAARALAAKQREAQREVERREEMKRLGILGVGKKRTTANGNGNLNGRFSTPPASDRARRSNAASSTASNGTAAHPSGGTSTRPARSNGRNIGNAIDHDALPVPSSQHKQEQPQQANGASSPLLSASGRLRRPANGSRGASPLPLTASATSSAAAATTGAGMVTRTRSPVVPPLELNDDHQKAGVMGKLLGTTESSGVMA